MNSMAFEYISEGATITFSFHRVSTLMTSRFFFKSLKMICGHYFIYIAEIKYFTNEVLR